MGQNPVPTSLNTQLLDVFSLLERPKSKATKTQQASTSYQNPFGLVFLRRRQEKPLLDFRCEAQKAELEAAKSASSVWWKWRFGRMEEALKVLEEPVNQFLFFVLNGGIMVVICNQWL